MITKLSRKDIKMLESSVKNDVSKSALEEYLSAHKKAETAWKVFRDSLVLSDGSSEDNAPKKVKDEKVLNWRLYYDIYYYRLVLFPFKSLFCKHDYYKKTWRVKESSLYRYSERLYCCEKCGKEKWIHGEYDTINALTKEEKEKFKTGDKVRVLSGKSNIATTKLRAGDITEVICYKGDDSKYATLDPNFRTVVVLDPLDAGGQGFFEEYALELVVEEQEKTPNELRAEIIQRAEEFVDECRNEKMVVRVDSRHYTVDVSFIVNADKRTVVALLRGVSTDLVRVKGIAKCNPDDVFNEHIGKAIALGRALGKDVSEFENAVQPTLTKGQIARFTPRYEGREIKIKIKKVDGEKLWFANKYGVEMYLGSGVSNSNIKIASDTHAEYEDLNNE